MNSFDKAFDRTVGHEGGFTDNPKDRGNWINGIIYDMPPGEAIRKGLLKGTKYGISAMSYPHLDIKNLTVEQAKEIYRVEFWNELGISRFPLVLHYQLFDAAVNHGIAGTIRMIQRAIGVADDGRIGPQTLSALAAMDHNDLALRFLAERLAFMTDLHTWHAFGRGWAVRIANNLRIAAEDN